MWVERLISVVNWEPLHLDLPWSDIEEGLGTTLSEDYKKLSEAFGNGEFSEFLQVLSVDSVGHFDLARTWRNHLDATPQEGPDPVFEPYEIYRPGRRGLISWGYGENDPAEWSIVTRGARYPWHQVDMCTSEFVYRLLTDRDFEPFSIARLFPEPDFYPIDPVA
ncbi:hypothetical protein ACFQVC_33950 [Streptomyces monticola]|uniref:SMI1/KNR4 family protein n=1 Tax=Streptomyces monticola TaxID=2666263 RepID=A0ABW2JTE4_9ACTN